MSRPSPVVRHRIDGIELRTLATGRADAERTFVLIHGIGMSHHTFSTLAVALRAHGRVVAVDLAGFGANRSPNGIIEYKSNSFGGGLKGSMLVVRYSGGDDILILSTDASGNIPSSGVKAGVTGLTGFVDPLDIAEHAAQAQRRGLWAQGPATP